MEPALLTTKFYVPPPRSTLVPRPRLVEQITPKKASRLTLISAPAGFGKTTLLSEWIHSLRSTTRVAWVSLDSRDNDPKRFWFCVTTALKTAGVELTQDLLEMLQYPQISSVDHLLTALINQIVRQGGKEGKRYVLVLDDYHLIDSQAIHQGLAFLIEHAPPQLRLVIASRIDPPLPLSRLRARGHLVELRAADLRFTFDEVKGFLGNVIDVDLPAQTVTALETRTEGWIAGIQLVALSLQARDAADISSFVAAFTGSHRYILDYLLDEVLESQPAEVHEFLLQTAVLDRLTASLCDAVVNGDGAAEERRSSWEMLDWLERTNLFVVPMDSERRWYRYHHLFRDILLEYLERLHPDQVPLLHRRASAWYEENGLTADAVSHALMAGDVDRAARLVEGDAFAMLAHGELATLAKWLGNLPEELIYARPWLCIAHAWVLAYTGPLNNVELLLSEAEKKFSPHLEEEQHLFGHITAIRAYVAAIRGDMAQAENYARQALDDLPEEDLETSSFITSLLASVLTLTGRRQSASKVHDQVIALSQISGSHQLAVSALCERAWTYVTKGKLHEAFHAYEEALEIARESIRHTGRRLPDLGDIYTNMSVILREWDEAEQAVEYARKGTALCEQWGFLELQADSYIYLAMALNATGDVDGALEAMQKAKRLAVNLSEWYVRSAEAFEAEIYLLQGNVGPVTRWAEERGLDKDDEFTFWETKIYTTLAQLRNAQGEFDTALYILERIYRKVEEEGSVPKLIKTLSLQAVALEVKGEQTLALDKLERALALGELGGFQRMFTVHGKPMVDLLRRVAARGIHPTYVSKLLAAANATPDSAVTRAEAAQAQLVEPITDREMEVLRLLADGLSNREIAHTLFITVNTVKNHLRNIYGKLDVNSRTQAVRVAQELGLLELPAL